tara:strand:+ start:1464 stop:2492 length:1029 start_codon:yes stop_codon:yes gene_type:complete
MDYTKYLKTQWNDYFKENKPYLSNMSHKLYSNQIVSISIDNNINDFDPLKFITRMVNKSSRDKSLSFILLNGAEQSQNQRISAVRNILEINKDALDSKKYNRLSQLLSSVGDTLRKNISSKVGTNIKTEHEKDAMEVTWNQLGEFAKNYSPNIDNINGFRNYVLLNLLLNNFIDKDEIKYYTLLRRIEYASLFIWTNLKKPPNNKKNYIYLSKNQLYIQHSKTTGGVRRIGNKIIEQPSLKTYPLNTDIKEIIKKYIKMYKIKNDQPLFYGNKGTKQINEVFYSALLKELLSPLNKNLNNTLLRKIYENRIIEKQTNANEKKELMKLVDHSLDVAMTFYHKI